MRHLLRACLIGARTFYDGKLGIDSTKICGILVYLSCPLRKASLLYRESILSPLQTESILSSEKRGALSSGERISPVL